MKIAIDPGHGKDGDPGAIGPSGLKEAQVTGNLAALLANSIACIGEEPYLCDRSLYSSERALQAAKDGCGLLISLHVNSAGPTATGIEAWYAHRNEEGKRLASALLGPLTSDLKAKSRGIKDDADWRPSNDPTWTGGMGVLRSFPGSGVLLELLFISNPQEEKLLSSPEFLKRCAEALACGLLDFLEAKKRTQGKEDPPQDMVPFPDLPPTLWGGKARRIALALRDLGIITGYEDGTFRPEEEITRMEAASMIYRVLSCLGKLPPLE